MSSCCGLPGTAGCSAKPGAPATSSSQRRHDMRPGSAAELRVEDWAALSNLNRAVRTVLAHAADTAPFPALNVRRARQSKPEV